MADDLNWFQRGIKYMTGAGPDDGYFPGDQSETTKYIPGVGASAPEGHGLIHNDIPYIGTKGEALETLKNVGYYGGSALAGGIPGVTTAAIADYVYDGGLGYNNDPGTGGIGKQTSIREFDMNDPESVKKVQKALGVKEDGMFGPKTEAAYRARVAEEDAAANKEVARYDYNDAMLQERMDGSKTKFGGLLKKAWHDADKNWFGGKLKGGYDESNVMTAEDYKNR